MRQLITIPLFAAAVLSSTYTYADIGDQLAKLMADDGAAGDNYGNFVGISGAIAIVGARNDDDNGSNSGSAYLFDTSKGWQIAKLLPDDGAANDRFGWSVGISGTTAIVGARKDDDNGSGSGSAYLFDTRTSLQIAKLLPDDGAAGDLFGGFVAISGAVAIVGAKSDQDNGVNSGSAYLFDTSKYQQIAKLLPDDGAAEDMFGDAVAISGTTAIVGAWGNDDNGSNSGSVYLFDVTNGQQIAKLLSDDGATEDIFGFSVAISGAFAIVGAKSDQDNGTNSGSAYLFDISNPANPIQIVKLLPSDGAANDHFGWSVQINGTTAIVGAWGNDDNGPKSGSAYLFDVTTGQQIIKLLPDDGAAEDYFGNSVGISGATAIVGARWDDDNGIDSGSAYLFEAADTATCPWDLDKSGTVGTGDLLELFAQWGTDGSADFDESGAVGTGDLLILFANWGPCE